MAPHKKCGWPLNRKYFGYLINALANAQVKATIFDVIWPMPQPEDPVVISAIENAKNVYLSLKFSKPVPYRGIFVSNGYDMISQSSYTKYAKGTGFTNTVADVDGKRRQTYPLIYYHNKPHLQLSFKVAADILGVPENEIYCQKGSLYFSNKLKMPVDITGCFIVNYAARWHDDRGFKSVSLADVVQADLENDEAKKSDLFKLLHGKICIVGLTAEGTHDNNPTPLDILYPMLGQYANILNGILERDFIRRLHPVPNMLIVIFGILFISYLSSRLKPAHGFMVTLLIALLFVASAITFFNGYFEPGSERGF